MTTTDTARPFRERLLPGPVQVVLCAALGLAVFLATLPIGTSVAVPTGVAVALVAAAALFLASPVVEVVAGGPGGQGDPGEAGPTLRAGRAAIAVARLGEVYELDREGIRLVLGPRADARSYLVHRTWVAEGVAVEVTDERDPTPLWVVSSRHPARLAAALRQAVGRPETSGSA